jgi:hypothetical protein
MWNRGEKVRMLIDILSVFFVKNAIQRKAVATTFSKGCLLVRDRGWRSRRERLTNVRTLQNLLATLVRRRVFHGSLPTLHCARSVP